MLLIVPFYMFSQKELAPTEDQSFIFGIIQASANSTIDQTKLFADAGRRGLPLDPGGGSRRSRSSSRTFGFGGMVTKPCDEREREHRGDPDGDVRMKTAAIPGIRVDPDHAAGAAGGGEGFPVDFAILSTAEPERLAEFAQSARRQGVRRAASSCSPTPI